VLGENSIFYTDARLPDGSAEDGIEIPIPDCAHYVVFNSTGFLNYTTDTRYHFTPQGNNITGLSIPLTIATYGADQGISSYTGPRLAQLGVFVGPGPAAPPAPATLDFTAASPGTAFSSLAPLTDQVFYIGNGFPASYSATTGLPTTIGTTRFVYNIPPGATVLRLGVAMVAGYYTSLVGSYTTTVQFSS
jgi:hypothetical protein